MTLRKVIFWAHLATGSTIGLVVAFLSITGILLAYRAQLVSFAERGYRTVAPTNAKPLPLDVLVASACEHMGAEASATVVRSDPAAPVEVDFGRERRLFLQPYSGAVLGEGATPLRQFLQRVEGWHRWFGLSGQSRTVARAVKGVVVLGFVFILLSGLYLWIPRRWTWQHLRPIVTLRGGVKARARDWNWHNAVGIWSAIPLLLISSTGVIMAFDWATNLLYTVTLSGPPPARREAPPRNGHLLPHEQIGFERLLAQAREHDGKWQSITLRVPEGKRRPVQLVIDNGDGGRPDLRTQWTVDNQTAKVLRQETFSSYKRGMQWRMWARFLHTGEAGGVIGETLAVLASFGACVLVWTGLSLALRRLRVYVARKQRTGANADQIVPALQD